MKKYEFSFSASWVFDEPVRNHNFLLRCLPGTYPFQRTYAHTLSVSPHAALSHGFDSYGNEIYTGTIDKAHSSFGFSATGFVLCSKYIIREPLDRMFLYPSLFTVPSDAMRGFLAGLTLPEAPLERAAALAKVVNERMSFSPGSTRIDAFAADVFARGEGVSRDFTHVLITLCRLAGIPARYVLGLTRGSNRAHVWTEAYCGSAWYAFDPTTGSQITEGYLKIAHGLDYSDCAVDRYCFVSESGADVSSAKTVSARVSDHLITVRDTVPRA